LIDILGLLLSFLLSTIILTRCDWMGMQAMRVLGAIASFCLIAKMYDWLRLFTATAFFIELIQ